MANITTNPSVETLSLIAHNQVPVITTELLAQLYGADIKNVQNNFARNASRFVEGKHFFKLTGEQLKEFRLQVASNYSQDLQPSLRWSQISPKTRSLILWTERGAARHAKMLDTDQAWEVFEKLEDCYFTKKPQEQLVLSNGQHYVVAKDGVVIFHKVLSDRTAKNYLPKPTATSPCLGDLQNLPKLADKVDYNQIRAALRQLVQIVGHHQPYSQVRPAVIVLETVEQLLIRMWTMIDEAKFRATLVENYAKKGQPLKDYEHDTVRHINQILSKNMMTVQLPSYQ